MLELQEQTHCALQLCESVFGQESKRSLSNGDLHATWKQKTCKAPVQRWKNTRESKE